VSEADDPRAPLRGTAPAAGIERALRDKPPEAAVSVELEVPFHDVDPLLVAWHGHYYKYFEIARQALQRKHRVDAPDLRGLGYHWYVIETRSRHVAPLRYAERFRVRAWFYEKDPRIGIAYEVTSLASGKRAARGVTTLVTTRADGEMLLETPREILDRIAGS
jgi:acyl-CoA thioester hydrolase